MTLTIEQLDAFAFEQLTVADSVKTLTSATYQPANANAARAAWITLDTAEIRYTLDGTTPTTTVGHAVASGSGFPLYGVNNLRGFKAIRTTGSSGVINVTYFR